MAGLVPATPLNRARPCHMIGVAGTSPAMTSGFGSSETDRCVSEEALLDDDLHELAGLELIVAIEAVEDPEAVELAVDEGHASGEVFDGVAGLDLDDLDPQRLGGTDF